LCITQGIPEHLPWCRTTPLIFRCGCTL
jgi:hypothetical protein